MKLSARRGQDLFIRHKGHFAFHYFRSVLLRMINSGRRVPLRRFRALFHRGFLPKRWRKAGWNLFVARIRRARAREMTAHLVVRVSTKPAARPSESLRFPEKSTTPIQHRGVLSFRLVVQLIRMNLDGTRCWINPGRGRYRDTRYTGHPAKLANAQRNFILAKIPFARMECKFIRGIPLAMTF